MTRNAFITQLEKRLADMLPSWEAKEEQLTEADVLVIMQRLHEVSSAARLQMWTEQHSEVKA